MRVAILEVSGTAVRSVIAETVGGRVRRLRDHTVAVGVQRAVDTGDVAGPGTAELLAETARRFRDAHDAAGVHRTHLVIAATIRADLEQAGVVRWLAEVLGADVLPSHPAVELGVLATAARASGALDGRPTVLVHLGDGRGRAAVVDRTSSSEVVDVRLPDLGGLGTVAQAAMGDRWLDVAVAAVGPLLDGLPAGGSMRPVLAAGRPVRGLAALAVARRWRRPLRTLDRVSITASQVMDLAAELSATTSAPRSTLPGLDGGDVRVLAGTAVALAGLMAATGAGSVLTTDAQRIDGHLVELSGATGPRGPAEAILEVTGPPTGHARQVAHLAGRLFDGLAPVHGLGPADREVLVAGALLHDVVRAEGPAHHRRGAEHVLGLAVPGLDPASLVEVACLVRAQRGRPPGSHVPVFLRLPESRRDAVRRLVAILRLADGLDRSGDGAVHDLLVDVDPNVACVHVVGDGVDLALYGARGQARYVERHLGTRLVVRATPQPLAST